MRTSIIAKVGPGNPCCVLWSIGMRQGILGSGHGMQHGGHEGNMPAMQQEMTPDS